VPGDLDEDAGNGDRRAPANKNPRERGDYPSYWRSLVFFGVAICFFLFLYHELDPMLTGLWGARSGEFLEEYRTWGAKLWRLLYRCTSSWTCLWLPILWALSTFLIQFGLKKNDAKLFNEVHVVLILVVSAMAFVSFFGLFLLPLGMWYPSNAATH